MDPIAIIGLAASLVQLISATRKVAATIHNAANGPEELRTIGNELPFFIESLIGFERVIQAKNTFHYISPAVIDKALANSKGLILDLDRRTKDILSSASVTVQRVKWLQHQSKIRECQEKLLLYSDILRGYVTIAQGDALHLLIDSQTKPLLAVKSGFMNQAGTLTSSSTFNSLSDSATLFDHAAEVEGYSNRNKADSDVSLSYGSTRPISPKDVFIIRPTCNFLCHCNCHEDAATTSFRRRLVTAQKQLQGRPVCTDEVCARRLSTRSQLKNGSGSLRKLLSNILPAKYLGTQFDVKIRIIPEASEAMRHVKRGNLEKLRGCIESGEATIWDTAPDGWSLLHAAAYARQLDIARYLLQLGAATNVSDLGSREPADFALLKYTAHHATANEMDLLHLFGDQENVLAGLEFNPIHIVVLGLYSHDDLEQPDLRSLIYLTDEANNAPLETNWTTWKQKYDGRSPLFRAILDYFDTPRRQKSTHDLLNQKDARYRWTPLHWAAHSGQVEKMRVLIEHGADPTLLSNLSANIIHAAAESRSCHGLAAALEIHRKCPDLKINQINVWGETALHVASSISVDCVQLLLDAGADPNIQDENGQVPLHFAGLSRKGTERERIAASLCNTVETMHLNIKDHTGRPPIFDFLDDANCVQLLADHGAVVDATDEDGRTALHHACAQGESETIRVILKIMAGADGVASTSKNGDTALHEALMHSHIDCAYQILAVEDIGPLMGSEGWAPVHYAARIGDMALIQRVCNHSTFQRASKTRDGQTASVIAMQARTWSKGVRETLRKYDTVQWEE